MRQQHINTSGDPIEAERIRHALDAPIEQPRIRPAPPLVPLGNRLVPVAAYGPRKKHAPAEVSDA